MCTFSQHSNKHVRRNQFTKHDRVGFTMGIIGAIGLILFCYHYGYDERQIQLLSSHSAMPIDVTIACRICHIPAPIKSAKQASRMFHHRPIAKDKSALEEIDRINYMDSVLAGGKP